MNKLVILGLSGLVAVSCQKQPADVQNDTGRVAKTVQIDPALAKATNRFGFSLLSRVWTGTDAASVMISPASVAMALSMTYNGAVGETQTMMAQTLEIGGFSVDSLNAAHKALRELLEDPNSDITLAIANSLWALEGLAFEPEFIARNRDYFKAELASLDFSDAGAAGKINGWVSDQTRGKIPTIVDQIDPNAILFLINAIYFKGAWTYRFDKEKTYDGTFHHPSGNRQRKFMTEEDDYTYLKGENFQAVRLPYGKSQRFAMYVFLPSEGTSLTQFTAGMSADQWDQWMGQFRSKKGELHLPRFTLNYKEKLNDALSAIGMGVAFDPGRADFSKMISVPGRNVFINAVSHKTFMEVNEEGTEAAAVTSVEVVVTSLPSPTDKFTMIVDRPFLCAIVDKDSGLILFLGTVSEFEQP